MVALEKVAHRVSRGLPRRLVAEDHRVPAEPGELGHCRHDEVVLELPASAAVERSRDQVTPDKIEGCRPAADPDSRPFAEALEILIVADWVLVVLREVVREIEAKAGQGSARESTIVVGRAVAHGAGRQLHVRRGRRPERQAAAGAEGVPGGSGGRAARETGSQDRHAHLGTADGHFVDRLIIRRRTCPDHPPSGGTAWDFGRGHPVVTGAARRLGYHRQMAGLSRSDVEHVAYLARLGMSPAELDRLQGQLNQILDQYAKLAELDTDAIPPTAQTIELENILRDDLVTPSLPQTAVLANAPLREGAFMVVPPILGGDGD